MTTDRIKVLTEDNFNDAIKEGISIVDFWAEWCGPCKIQGPILEVFAKTASPELTIGKVDVSENQKLAAKFDVMSIPSILVFKNGELIKKHVGVQSEESLQDAIKV